MILKGVTNFERKLICDLKNDTRNLVNFHASSRKPENSQFDRILLSKAYKDLDEKAQKSYVSWYWKVMQGLKKKLILGSKNFNASSSKSENLHFDVILLSIAHKVSTKKLQNNYNSWHWKKIQTLKKNWLFIWKMAWEIWWTLTWAVQSPKICTLVGCFCRKYVMCGLKSYRGVVSWKRTYGFKNGVSNLVNFHTSSWK